MADKVKVRLTIRPDEDTEVDADEVGNLRAQGLLLENGEPAADEAAREYEAARKRAAEEREERAKGSKATGQKAGG